MTTLKIYATPLSANGRKVLAVSRHLGLSPEIHEVNVYRGEGRAPAYLAINPSGKIPTLIDGEFESAQWQPTLIAFLSELVGHRLLPEGIPEPRHPPDWSSAPVQPILKTLQTALSAEAFLTGPTPTIADFAVAGMMTYFRAAAFPFQRFPKIADWYARIESLDSWRATESPLWT